jgi:catechol 2,3-dioxygenase-like lactoylglutathione lyase family enzyme
MDSYADQRGALQEVTLHVSDSRRSFAFYRELLGFRLIKQQEDGSGFTSLLDTGNGHRLRLVSFATPLQPSPWTPDDLQPGYRNVPFTLDPLDALGGVRIAFFQDPDGILLELIEGSLEYHEVGAAVAPARPDRPRVQGEGELLFDHVALTVSDPAQARLFYQEQLGFPLLGKLFFNDARDFTITYLQAGLSVLELFSFSVPTLSRPLPSSAPALGIQRMGFVVDDLPDLDKQIRVGGVLEAIPDASSDERARTEDRADYRLLTDPEGNLIEFRRGKRL